MTLPQPTDGSFPNQYNVSIGEGRGTVIGDHNVVIQQFTTGIKAFSIDYATRVHNFLTTYLGTAQRPEPFGGRQGELQALNHWLDNPQAPPYLLLASTAGR